MSTATVLPHVTATFNAITIGFLLAGFLLIRGGRREAHRAAMLGALTSSALFLVFYLIYHFTAPIFVFKGQGWVRPFYYTVMISHILLAMAVTPMVLMTAWRGWRGRFERHRPLARWTLPLWLYVSVSGLVVYVMLYHMTWA